MGDKPIWEQIGSSFVQHYYQIFDADRTQLGAIYVSMYKKGAGALSCCLSRFPYFDVQEHAGWDSGFYPESRISVSAITLTQLLFIAFLLQFISILSFICLIYRQSES